MNMDCKAGTCGHPGHEPEPTGFNLTPDETGVCRFETDPEAIRAIQHAAKMLRAAKEAHSAWERSFEGLIPKHDWETWYAQWMLAQTVRKGGNPVVPCSITKLGALVGPLD